MRTRRGSSFQLIVNAQSSWAKQELLIAIVVSGRVIVPPSAGEPAARSAIQLSSLLPSHSSLSSSVLQPYRTFAPLQSMTRNSAISVSSRQSLLGS